MDYKIILALIVISGLFLFWYFRKSSGADGCNDKSDDIKIVRLVYQDGCGACEEFKSTWKQLKEKYSGQHIVFEEIDNLANPTGVEYVPAIIMEKEGEQLEFKDERTLEKLSKFVEL